MAAGVPTRRQFEQTHWSTVMRTDAGPAADMRAALAALCARFRYPVYAYLRRSGHGPATARHLARDFLGHVFAHGGGPGAAPVQGRFRQYLLSRLREFLAEDHGAGLDAQSVAVLEGPDLEARFIDECAEAPTAEHAYQRGFAAEVVARALAQLRDEALQSGRLDMFAALEPFLARDPTPAEGGELSRRLGMRPVVLAAALRRLRQRFRELADSDLAETVASADELAAEQALLFLALQSG